MDAVASFLPEGIGVRLDWRLTETDRRTVRRTTRLMCERLQGVADIRVEPLAGALDGSCLGRPDWQWHHMGTARMGDDPRRSVVEILPAAPGKASKP